MSIRVMADVWDVGPEDPVECFVLVALASHCNDNGDSCFPSITRIAQMTRRSERTVVRAIGAMEKAGWITIERGSGRGKVSKYHVNVAKLKGRQCDTLLAERVTAATGKGDTLTEKGDSGDIAIRKNSQEPSIETSNPSRLKKRERGELKTRIEGFVKSVIIQRTNLPTAPWDGGAMAQLNRLVDSNPSWTDEDFERLLRNWSHSDPELVRFGDHPKRLLSNLGRFAAGPVKRLQPQNIPKPVPVSNTKPVDEVLERMYK